MIAFILLAAASAWLVTRRAPQHRPIAWALTACAGLDAARLMPMPERWNMALACLMPAVSAWGTYAAFRPMGRLRAATGIAAHWTPWVAGILTGRNVADWWHAPLPWLYGVACVVGLVAGLRRGPWTITQRVAAMLLLGDVAALVRLCSNHALPYQAGIVLGLVAAYQVWWAWRWRRGIRSNGRGG